MIDLVGAPSSDANPDDDEGQLRGRDFSRLCGLFPGSLDDYIAEDNPVRVVDVFVDGLGLKELGFEGAEPEATGRPAYHPATMLKIYIYGYLNRIQSSRRLERETQRNVELIWLTGKLSADFKTIADFRRDNGKSIRRVCREFVVLCRSLNLFSDALVAIDGSKFKAVNGRDRNFTQHKLKARIGRSSPRSASRRKKRSARKRLPLWRIAAITQAPRSSSASRPASMRWCPNPIPRTIWPRGSLTSATSTTSLRRTSTAARPVSDLAF